MRMTLVSVLCGLLAMVCWVEATATMDKSNHLRSTIKQVVLLMKAVKQNDSLFYSPTNDIEDCCSQSALQCFHSQLLNISSISSKHLKIKLWKNLKKNNIVTSVDNCSQEERDNVTCKSCDSYLMVNSKEFLKNLLSLLQKSFSKLP